MSQVEPLQSPHSPKHKTGTHIHSNFTPTLEDHTSPRGGETMSSHNTPLTRHVRQFSHSNISLNGSRPESEEPEATETVPYVFPDLQALQSIFSKDVYKYVTITGFEIYIVEQWACDRQYSTVITSYTGDSLHKIKAGRVRIPRDTSQWSDKLTKFIEEIENSGAKLKETEHGYMFITNLSSFPSHLNLIPIPSGRVEDVWDLFKVNVNLRRMNCGGRSALFLCLPSDACEDKFRQIYKTHPKVDIPYAVKELVTLIQICLVDFKLLDPLFVDGLLCNITEAKIKDWWNLFGSLYYGTIPKDGILGPTTISAILGFVLSCLYRLDMASVDFPKEPFNYFNFRVNVGKFQKANNLTRTWYLDPITVEKLFRVTSKNSTSDKLKKVVKSTVHDISGKLGSENAARNVLTTDLDKAIKYFTCSPRLHYLWYGKGDLRDLKQFDYNIARSPQSALMSASALRSGVDKIRGLPKKLQGDDTAFPSGSFPQRKKEQDKEAYETSDEVTTDEALCQALKQCVEISGGVCGVNILTDDQTFKNSLERRLSFPYLANEVSVPQLEYENHNVDFIGKRDYNCALKRSKSFSFIEEMVIDWDNSLVVPEVVARRVKAIHQKSLTSKSHWESYCREMKRHKSRLDRSSMSSLQLIQRTKPVFHQCDMQLQADERLHSKLSDIRATGARLEYEIRLLSTRVRDTQDSVDNFVAKVESLEASILSSYPTAKLMTSPQTGNSCDGSGTMGHYTINKERIGKVWGMIEQFGAMKWANSLLSTMQRRCEEKKGEDMVQQEPDQKLEKAGKQEQTTAFVIHEKAKQN